MSRDKLSADYVYRDAGLAHTHVYLLPALKAFLEKVRPSALFELGCGNGAVANFISESGIRVTAIDYSETGVTQANRAYPQLRVEVGSAYDDLETKYGKFPVVVSLEVIEHLYEPRKLIGNVFALLQPGGYVFISTPYHGYLKNLAISVTGKMDAHFTALWDGGHIKFFSIATLKILLEEAGFIDIQFQRVGRVPVLAKSMIAIARRPG